MDCPENSTCWDSYGVLDTEANGFCLGPVLKHWYQAISFLFFLAGSFGNLTVIIVILKSVQELSSTDMFIVGLAFLDLVSSVFLPLHYFLDITGLVGRQSGHTCRFLSLMYEVSIIMSIYVLMFTVYSFYRKIARAKPDDNKKTRFFGLFVIAFLLAAVPAFPFVSGVDSVHGFCHISIGSYTNFVLYSVVMFIIQVILPVLIFTIMFTRIGVEVYLEHERQQSHMEADVQLIERARDQRKSRLLMLLVGAFYSFYVPYIFATLWFIMDSGSMIQSRFECLIVDTFHLIICCKCFCNPIVYYFFYDGFKDNFKRILCGCKIGRRYNFMHVKYNLRRDHQDGLIQQEVTGPDDQEMMQDWVPYRQPIESNKESELDDKDHDYEEEQEDHVAILRPWKNFKSTSSF